MHHSPTRSSLPYVAAIPMRVSMLRLANGRLEARLPTNNPDYQHPEAAITLALAGALYGLKEKTQDELSKLMPAKPNQRLMFQQFGSDMNATMQSLSTLRFVGNELVMDHDFLEKHSTFIEGEFEPYWKATYGSEADFNKIRYLLSRIYLKNGEAQFPTELEGFFKGGSIRYKGLADSFEISPGYPIGTNFSRSEMGVRTLQKSKIVKEALSPEFFDELCQHAAKHFGEPPDMLSFRSGIMDTAIANAVAAARELEPAGRGSSASRRI